MAHHKLNRVFAALYIAWAAAWLWLEIHIEDVPAQHWLILFGTFLVLELTGVFRRGAGDTWSEFWWVFGEAGWSRAILLAGLAGALSLRFFSFPFLVAGELPWAFLQWGPWAFLAVGLGGWLGVHFTTAGRHG